MLPQYLIQGKMISAESDGYQEALRHCYAGKIRPFCPCRKPPVAMYIAKVNGNCVVKRMPNTGSEHDLECKSYEIPGGLSGLSQVMGSAIKEDSDNGLTTLKFDFSLSKGVSRAVPHGDSEAKNSVKTDGKRLSLRGLLHYLWEQAEFNKWSPGMVGKRNWFVIRKYLYEAAKLKQAKNISLDSLLFVPEVFDLDQQQDIAQRRQLKLNFLNGANKHQPFMLVIGEVKDIVEARIGHKMVIKHLPDFPILLNNDMYRRLNKHFVSEIELWSANEQGHLLAIGTFGVNASGIAIFQEMALMVTNEQWIPYDNADELNLITTLIQSRRRFIKCLRYNLPTTIPTVSALLTEKDNETTGVFIKPSNATDDFEEAVKVMIEGSRIRARYWQPELGSMPE
jgi:hypothetical protein